MKKIVIALAILALASQAFAVSPDVRIAQVYSGGGSGTAGATYKKDYVVLFNNSGVDVNISQWAIEYGSATGLWASSATNYFVFPGARGGGGTVGTWIPACSYLFIALATPGTAGADFAVTPDFTTTNLSMSASSGRVGLFNSLQNGTGTGVACGLEVPGTLVDKVCWVNTLCPEGTTITGTLSTAVGFNRKNFGALDTDNNATDFAIVTNPVPMYSGTPALACQTVATEGQTWGALKSSFR